jgi:uncharacterized protein
MLCPTMTARAWDIVPEVKDGAHFFSSDTIAKANRDIAEIQKKYHKDLVVDTVAMLPADKVEAFKAMRERDKAKFWQQWAIDRAKAARVKGIYVLICKNPGHVQVEVGDETAKNVFRVPNDRNHFADILIRRFQEKECDTGLLESIQFADQRIAENLGQRPRAEVQGLIHAKANQAAQGASGTSWIVMLIVVLIGFWILRAIFRGGGGPGYGRGPRPNYGGPGYGEGAAG